MTADRLFPVSQEVYTSDDYYTPRWIFDALKVSFDLDVASPEDGPRHTPADRYFSQSKCGLANTWAGRVFMNPPYSKATPWVNKFMMHKNGIALVPMAKSQWFNDMWNDCDAVMALPKKTMFEHAENKSGSIFLPVMLAAYGPACVHALHTSALGRVR